MVNSHVRGYEAIKAMAKELRVNIPTLLVSARQNDPFMAGTPAQRERAEWFNALWQEFGFTDGVHLRRVHYKLVSQHKPLRHDGKPYRRLQRISIRRCQPCQSQMRLARMRVSGSLILGESILSSSLCTSSAKW